MEEGDSEAVRGFLAEHAGRAALPSTALIGKLVGELVAVMEIDLSAPRSVGIECLVVAPAYRRKRIGRVMMRELESLAEKMECNWLTADPGAETREFLRRVGFVDGEGTRMVRKVG